MCKSGAQPPAAAPVGPNLYLACRRPRGFHGPGPDRAPYPADAILIDLTSKSSPFVLQKKFKATKFGSAEKRKRVFVPGMWRWLESDANAFEAVNGISTLLREQKRPLVIFDVYGPRAADGSMQCVRVTSHMLRERVNDVRHAFGHGYVVASFAADIAFDGWCV